MNDDQDEHVDEGPSTRGTARNLAVWLAMATVLMGTITLVAVFAGDSTSDTPVGPDVAVVGDAFVQRSLAQLDAEADRRGLTLVGYGALTRTSVCQFTFALDQLAEHPPRVLVLSFAGDDPPNTCSNPTDGVRDADAVVVAYRAEVEAVARRFAELGSKVYVVMPPPGRDDDAERISAMRALYREMRDGPPELGVIDSALQLDPEGKGFVEALPCEDWDTDCPAGGQVVVREDDGIQITAAGAERYARAILDAVEADLDE